MTLGEYIKQYREEHGLSQREFAAQAELTCGYISMLENNKNPRTKLPISPTVRVYEKVSDATGVPLGELLQAVDDRITVNTKDSHPINYPRKHTRSMRTVSKKELMHALWGDQHMTDSDLEDVKRYAAFLAEKRNGK